MAESKSFDEQVRAELAPELVVLRPLGRGSVACVYLAHEPALDRQVAVKVLQPRHAADATTRRRFEREARSAARINHPNVTAVFRVGRLSNELPFLVMEYVDGRNLEDALAAAGGMSVREGRDVLRQLAAGLAAAHAQQVVHRDVKPANVLLENGTGRVVLTDFGLAAARDRTDDTTKLTMVGQVLGSLEYVSPEHLSGEELTELADIYALGVLGYHVLANRGPYEASSAAALTIAHLQSEPLVLTTLRREVDTALSSLLGRCLAKKPAQRPTAMQIAEQLTGGASSPAPNSTEVPAPETAFGQFLAELKRRRVYRVGVAYLAFTVALISVMDGVETALGLTPAGSRAILGAVLAGLPVTLTLSWMFDVRAGRIERTEDVGGEAAGLDRVIPVIALVLSLILAGLVWWGIQRVG